MMQKVSKILVQMAIFSGVLFVSDVISSFLPLPIPASVIGIILLFLALHTGIIKLAWVEDLGETFIANISFLFVPSSISLITSLDIIKGQELKILGLIFFWTLVAMVAVMLIGDGIQWGKAILAKHASASATLGHVSNRE